MGHIISESGIQIDPDKVRAIQNMPTPKNTTDLRKFLGMVNYLAKFIENLSKEALILRELDRKDSDWQWNDKHQEAFDNLKEKISNCSTLKYFDPNDKITLQCDASDYALGAVLLQKVRPVYYASRTLTPSEKNYA